MPNDMFTLLTSADHQHVLAAAGSGEAIAVLEVGDDNVRDRGVLKLGFSLFCFALDDSDLLFVSVQGMPAGLPVTYCIGLSSRIYEYTVLVYVLRDFYGLWIQGRI